MSTKFLVNLFMLNTKAVVNAYTWTTLPFYTVAQQPWRKLKLSKSFGVRAIKDGQGRTVYSRPCPVEVSHPLMTYQTLNEVIPHLDPKRRAVGYREVLSEEPQLDERGQPIKIDGKELKRIKLADDYQWWTVEQVLERVDALARGLQTLGVTQGSKVLIYADNSFDWFCSGLAVGRLNAITVTLLSILNDEGVVYGCNQSEAPFIITSQELLPRLHRISPQLKHLKQVVYFVDKLNPADPKATKAVRGLKEGAKCEVATLDQVHQIGAKLPPIEFKFPHADDVTLIMFTSGTTGKPKGVILTHRQLTESLLNIMRMQEEMKISLVGTSYAAYLPMGHLYGYLLNLGCFFSDAALALCSPMTMTEFSPAHVPGQKGDFQLIKPQFLGGVPLVLDRILKEVIRKLESRTPVSVPIFNYLMDYKIRWLARGYDTPIVNFLVCKKINSQFGGNFRIMLCGSAPLNERTQALMGAALNIKLLQAYGLTEVAVGATGMMTHDLTYGHCGVPLNSVRYYLKDWEEGGYLASENKGEIVIGGPIVANGYYKMPEETAESFKVDPDGTRWFETGDIGQVLPNGCLKIIDRKKDLVKLSNGEFVSLGKIEAGLRSCNLIENACACTDPYSNHVTAVISPNRKAMAELGERLQKPSSLSFEQLCDDADVQRHFFNTIKESSRAMGFAKKEIPVRIVLVKEEWTQDNNLLTAAMKMKRKQVNEYYRAEIKQMFADANSEQSSPSSSSSSSSSKATATSESGRSP